MNTQQPQLKRPLKEALFKKIESEKVCPIPKLFFNCRECLMWMLWIVSIVIGSLAMAVTVFSVTHRQYSLYEAVHENFLTFLIDALPYLWLSVFAVMTLVAVYNLRHTKHGYRHSVIIVVLSSVLMSVVIGTALQYMGLGYAIDDALGNNMKGYISQEKFEQRVWQDPENGRLLGSKILGSDNAPESVYFKDDSGYEWEINIEDLNEIDSALLDTGKIVRMIGQAEDLEEGNFHSCGVFPWFANKEVSLSELSDTRIAFLEKINFHQTKEKRRMENQRLGDRLASASSSDESSVCADILSVRRMVVY